MHILFITDNFYPEGNAIASRVYERACYWVEWGHKVTVITSAPNFPEGKIYPGYKNKWYQIEIIKGIEVVRVKTFIKSNKGFFLRIIDFLSFMIPAFLAGLIQDKPDAIAATSPQFFGAISACILSKFKSVPFLLEVGDIWPASIVGVGAMRESLFIRFLEKIEMWLYKFSNKIIVVSPFFKEDLIERGVPKNKIEVILNGVDLSKFTPQTKNIALSKKYNLNENSFVVGYIGTLGMAHGLHNVLMVADILKEVKNIKFIFVGGGAEREKLITIAKKMQLDNTVFIPPQPKERIINFWSLCDIALVHFRNSPVFSASIPSKMFEAMGMGLPIVLCGPRGAASQIVLNDNAGIWVHPEEPNKLAEAILSLFHDKKKLNCFAKESAYSATRHTRGMQAKYFLDSLLNIKNFPVLNTI